MTFYGEKESNILKTWAYLTLMSLFVVAVGWCISYYTGSYIFLWIGLIVSIFSSFFSYFYSDKLVLRMSNAKEIEKDDYPEYYRIVENLTISEGMPMPKLFIIEEDQPNAFATGRNPENSVIAVTRGLLEIMDRTELEAVLAHELSHIKNRDILLSTVVVVLAATVAFMSRIFLRSTMFGRRNEGKGGVITLIFALLAAILAPLVATIIKLAVSRKREYLADSSAALMTRHPQGLAEALQKIKDFPKSMEKASDATAHLYIMNPFREDDGQKWIHKLFATHPPLEERIKKLQEIDV
ncbi:MAG: M48 family metallopeptidase [Patescibacteria group bacterium]